MEDFLDSLWFKIVAGIHYLSDLMDRILEPLHVLGPGPVIFILVIITILTTKTLSRVYTTKRYKELQKEFNHWFKLREEAIKSEDREKGKALAKNIDKAELNKVYYDYFFEGLLNNIPTIYLPILTMAAYVNEAYKTDNLIKKFGAGYVFRFSGSGGEPVVIGALFLFVVTLLLSYLIWFIVEKRLKKPLEEGK